MVLPRSKKYILMGMSDASFCRNEEISKYLIRNANNGGKKLILKLHLSVFVGRANKSEHLTKKRFFDEGRTLFLVSVLTS
jgi:hypothetical protein